MASTQSTATHSSSLPNSSGTEIDLKQVFLVIKRNKWLIVMSTILFVLLATVFAYFSPKIYEASTTLEITVDQTAPKNDFMEMAMSGTNANLDNEMVILQSRAIAKEALQNLNIGIRYYTTERFKSIELYKSSPFVVKSEFITPKATEYIFQLIPTVDDQFRLVVEPPTKKKIINKLRSYISPQPENEKPIFYDELHQYGERISTPWFTISIQKIYQAMNEHYSFTIKPNAEMSYFIVNGLTAAPPSDVTAGTIINLTFKDNVALRAKDILDAVTTAYIQKDLDQNTQSAKQKLTFLDNQLDALNKTLESSATKLQTYKSSKTVVNLGGKATLTAAKLNQLETQLQELDMQMNILANVLNYTETHDDIKGIDVASTQANATVTDIIRKIQAANSTRTALLVDYTEVHPDVIKVNHELMTLKQTLKESIKSSLRSMKNRKRSLNNIISQQKRTLEAIPEQEQQLEKLSRNKTVNDKIYSYLLEKRSETAILESSTVPKIRVIDAPLVPTRPIKPKRLLIIFIGFIMGLLVGVGISFLKSFMDDTIKSIEDIENLTAIPLYGSIPFLHSQKIIEPYQEALRAIRTNLEFLQNSDKSKLITVTSSIPSEGKTSTVSELAKIIAQSGKKVILLDMDMRRSTIHEKFALPNEEGTSTLLAGKNSLDEVIQTTKQENLDVITSGPIPPNPSELLMSNELTNITQTLLSKYDYILLDSPPIGLVTDAMIIMRMSDVNLIVLKANYSKKDFINNINRFVEDHKLHAGIILNGVTLDEESGYGYGYSNNYYSKS